MVKVTVAAVMFTIGMSSLRMVKVVIAVPRVTLPCAWVISRVAVMVSLGSGVVSPNMPTPTKVLESKVEEIAEPNPALSVQFSPNGFPANRAT